MALFLRCEYFNNYDVNYDTIVYCFTDKQKQVSLLNNLKGNVHITLGQLGTLRLVCMSAVLLRGRNNLHQWFPALPTHQSHLGSVKIILIPRPYS